KKEYLFSCKYYLCLLKIFKHLMQKKKPYQRGPIKKVNEHRLNQEITATHVRITGEEVESEVVPIEKALQMAQELEVDLVEISPNANPPVVRLVDYNKFLYEKKKRDKEQKSKSKQSE